MGQAIGFPCPVAGAAPFTNLPREAIAGLLTSYGINGESWSLNAESLKDIVVNASNVGNSAGVTDESITQLFETFDTDLNGLVDTLEWLVTIALVSGMDSIEKVQFVFSLYDFEKTGLLGRDAVCLLLRSAVKGLAKVCPSQVAVSNVTFQDVEDAVDVLFYGAPRAHPDYVSQTEFQAFCLRHPVLSSWLKFFAAVSPLVDNVPVVFRGAGEVPAPALAPPVGAAAVPTAADPCVAAISVEASDFDKFYKPSVRAPTDLPVQLPPGEGEEEPVAEEPPAPVDAPVEEAKADGEAPAEGGEGEGEEKGEGEEEAAPAEEEEAAPAEGEDGEAGEAPKPVKPKPLKAPAPFDTPDLSAAALPWFAKTELMRPEEVPPFRVDKPEDQLEPLWVHGLGAGKHDADELTRFAAYSATDSIVYPAARMVVSMTRKVGDDEAAASSEEGYDPDADPIKGPFVYAQQVLLEHAYPITAADMDRTGQYLITADKIVLPAGTEPGPLTDPARVVLWDLAASVVKGSVEVPLATAMGVRSVNFSPTGRLFLVLLADEASTVCVYQTSSQKLLFAAPLVGAYVTPTAETAAGVMHVTDVRFTGTDKVFVVTSTHGVHFYVDEGTAVLGPAALRAYEKRAGLYEEAGRDAEGVVATVAQRLDKDEVVIGTAVGHVTLWKGRCCAHLHASHRGPVTALSYSRDSGVIASGGKDNKVHLFQTTSGPGPRALAIVGSIDLLTLDIADRRVRSLCLHASGKRVLVALHSGEIRELASDVRLKPRELPPPVVEKTAEELAAEAEAAAAAAAEGEASGESKGEGEGEAPPEKTPEELEAEAAAAEAAEKERKRRKLGDDYNNGPIVAAHWLSGKGAAIDAVAKVASGGFLTSGRDGSVKFWQTAEGVPQACAKTFTLPPVPGLAPGAEVRTKMAVSAEYVVLAVPGGVLQVLSLPDLVPVYEHKHTESAAATDDELWARDVKFAPDGLTLGVAAADGQITLYTVTPGALVLAPAGGDGAEGEAPPPAAEEPAEGGEAAAPPAKFLAVKETFTVDFAPGAFDFSADAQYMRLTDVARGVLSVRQLFYTPPPAVEATDAAPPAEGEDGEAAPAEPAAPVEPPKGIAVGTECNDAEILRPMTFATNAVPCSWDLKGCWNAHAGAVGWDEGAAWDPIVTCERNEALFVAGAPSGKLALTRVPQPLFVPCPARKGVPTNQQHVVAHVGPVAGMIFIEEGTKLVTAGAEDGLIIVWKVTYDAEEADPANMASIPNIKKPSEDGEEAAEEAAPPAEEEEEAPAEEEAEELDDEGNPIPRGPVLYDSAEEEDLFDGRRMKTHLALVARPAVVKRRAVEGLGLLGKDAYNPASKERLSAVLPWAAGVGLSPASLEMLSHRPPMDGAGAATPTDELKLHWVHGYSCRLTRGAVRYTSEGQIVYPAAAMAVTLDKVQRQQLHTMAHGDEVTCLDVHLKAGVAASAHKGAGDIFACVWEPSTGRVLQRLNCGAVNGVSALAFSPDGSLLAVALQDDQHQILLWDWKRGLLKARVDGGRKKVLCLAFSLCPPPPPSEDAPPPPPADVAAAQARASLFPPANCLAPPLNLPVRVLQAGVGHFSFLELKAPLVGQAGAVPVAHGGRVLTSRAGSYGADVKKVNVLCCAALPLPEDGGDEFVMGMANGQLGVVARGERAAGRFVDVQKGALTAVWVVNLPKNEEGQLFKLVTGGTNGFIKVLDQSFEPLAEFNLYRIPEAYGNLLPMGKVRGVKSICVDRFNRKILYGTAGGEIGELELDGGKDVNRGPLVRSHYRDELHAVATHPLRQQCLTAGDDKTLRVWNLETSAMETSIDLPDVARCAAFAPNGLLVAVGLGGAVRGLNRPVPRPCNGQVAIVSYLQGVLNIVHRTTDAKEAVTAVVFSPDGSRLYSGALDGVVYVYDALNNFKLVQKMYSPKEGVVSLDVTADGRYLVSMGTVAEVNVWDTTTYLMVDDREKAALLSGQSGPVQWHARQGIFGVDAVGAFPLYGSSDEVLCLSKSHDSQLLVTGTHAGQLQLRTYPSKAVDAPSRVYHGHSAGGVAKAAFSVGDKYLLSVGRDDRILLQWKVMRNAPPAAPAGPLSAFGKPPAKPMQEGDLFGQRKAHELTLKVHDVDFAEAFSRNDKALQEPLVVTLAAGFGCGAPGATTQAVYAGAGDVVTVQGRSVASLAGGDRLTTRHWTQYGSEVGDDVGVFAVSPDRRYLAVASRYPAPLAPVDGAIPGATTSLSVYAAATGALVSLLSADLLGEVRTLCFSFDGSAVAYLLDDVHHTLGVFSSARGDWTDSVAVHATATGEADMAAAVMAFIFSPRRFFSSTSDKAAPLPEPPAADADPLVVPVPEVAGEVVPEPQYYDLVTGGATGAVRFWGINGRNLVAAPGDLAGTVDASAPASAVTAVCGLLGADVVVTGDAAGQLWVWVGSTATRVTTLQGGHDFPVTALLPFSVAPETEYTSWGGQGFISAARDKIAIWSWAYNTWCEQTKTFSFADLFASPSLSMLTLPAGKEQPDVTSLSVDASTKRILATLSTGTLLEIAVESRTNAASVLTEGVSAAATAIAAHPTERHTVVTGDADGLLKVWDVSTANHGVTATVKLPRPATALAFHASGAVVAGLAGGPGASPSLIWLGFSQPYAPGTTPRLLTELTTVPLVTPAPPPAKGKKPEPPTVINAPLSATFNNGLPGTKVHSIALSEDGKLVAVGLDGGAVSVCLLGSGEATATPLQAHPAAAGAVAGLDFSADGQYLRTFSSAPSTLARDYKMEVHYFKMSGASAVEVTDKKVLKDLFTAKWLSCSSPAAPEASATMPFAPANPAALADGHPVQVWGRAVTSVSAYASPGGDGSILHAATVSALTNAEVLVRMQKELQTRNVPEAEAHAKRVATELRENDGKDCLSTMARKLREQLRELGVTDYSKLTKAIIKDFREQAAANLKTKGTTKGVVAAGYSDGTVEIYRHPGVSAAGPLKKLASHGHGAVMTAFTAAGQLCTIGAADGALMVWDVRSV